MIDEQQHPAGFPRAGILLTFQSCPEAGLSAAQAYKESVELAAEAERLGIDDIWLTEHHGEEDGYCPSPHVAAGALAAATRHVRIAHGISIAPLQGHPLKMAEDLSVVDNLSGGRVEIGLGQGYRREEFDAVGMQYARRTVALEESLDVLQLAWSGQRFDYEGSVYTSSGAVLRPAPVHPGVPPLWLGAATPKARQRVVRRQAGLVVSPLTDFRHTARQFASFAREEAAQGSPRLPRALIREMFIADTDDEALRRVAPYLDYIYRVQYAPERTGITYIDHRTGERRTIRSALDPYYLSEDFIRDRFVVGSVETCARQVTEMVRVMDLDRLVFRPQFPGQPMKEAMETIRRFVGEVIPLARTHLQEPTDEQGPGR